MNNLPKDWDCVQLTCIRNNDSLLQIKLRDRLWDDWSTSAYMLKRKHAKKILNNYYSNNIFNLEIKFNRLQAIVENLLYLNGKTYIIYLLNINLKYLENVTVFKNYSNFIINWWKENGKLKNNDYIFNRSLDFNWGNMAFYREWIGEEVFDKKIYEKFHEVKENDIVMDIGANVGSFTYSILNKKPKHVYCIEPSNTLINTLIENTKGYSVTHINKAISNTNDKFKIKDEKIN
jgi:hypothetical protein